MTKYYTIRVVLHENHVELSQYSQGYSDLRAGMLAQGYKQTIANDAGVTYLLPAGEYAASSSDEITCPQVRAHVAGIAAATGHSHAVYACEVVNFAWEGLKEA
jgi:hypothetical protein